MYDLSTAPPNARRDDTALVALLRSDGKPRQAAITQLYARYGREFKGYFRRHGASDAQAEDLLQETFIKVLRAIDSWHGSGTLEAWLWTVARNTFISHTRSEAADKADVSLDDSRDDAGDDPGHTLAARLAGRDGSPADTDCVKRGLAGFSDRFAEYAHVLERVVIDDWGYEELAQYRGCAQGAAREYLSQCRKRLWQYVGHCFEPAPR
ncbi:MAG: sigma-70 family RNA polymerase sigma factor [Burkholderiaceae bacterium]|jgi:RNA polymerase sigma-70 factor (ECF subfamily)|nr:sigma-70 family RNA polymerase sigma factor [Burkholderiaceae bacterium]